MNIIEYTMQGDYRLPVLSLPQQEEVSLGRYARMREKFLKEHRKATYTSLLASCKLAQHLEETEQMAVTRMQQLMEEMKAREQITEEMKERDPLKWAGLMNNTRQAAEEIILQELIHN